MAGSAKFAMDFFADNLTSHFVGKRFYVPASNVTLKINKVEVSNMSMAQNNNTIGFTIKLSDIDNRIVNQSFYWDLNFKLDPQMIAESVADWFKLHLEEIPDTEVARNLYEANL